MEGPKVSLSEKDDERVLSSNYHDISSMDPRGYEHRETETDPEGDDHYDFIEQTDSASEKCLYKHKELTTDRYSEILDLECGEPMLSQHISIDFNPWEGYDDNEFVLSKCMDFWKLVETSPLIQHLKVLPDVMVDCKNVSTSDGSENSESKEELLLPQLDAIDIIERKGHILNDVFVNKFKTRYCEEGSGDFLPSSPEAEHSAKLISFSELPEGSTKNRQIHEVMSKSGIVAKKGHVLRGQHEELVKLCKDLEEWDINHPKSMEPPGHEPILSHAVMQK